MYVYSLSSLLLLFNALKSKMEKCSYLIQNEDVSVFETTIRSLGGLVSMYELTNDKMFLDKAEELGKKLSNAFNSPTGLPYKYMDMKR